MPQAAPRRRTRHQLQYHTVIELRQDLGWSQTEVADWLGVTQSAVAQWECGDTQPSGAHLAGLALLFDVKMDRLLGR